VYGSEVTASVRNDIRQQARANIFEPAMNIDDRVLDLNPSKPLATLLSVPNLARAANYHRRRHRPADPTELDLVLRQPAIPSDFFVEDVSVHSDRHLIFGTGNMRNLLGKAKEWFVDGTFKVVKRSFQRLFTIHTSVQCNGAVKQIPLIYILMSARRKCAYHTVLRALQRKLPPLLA